jgi:hypothetical protein
MKTLIDLAMNSGVFMAVSLFLLFAKPGLTQMVIVNRATVIEVKNGSATLEGVRDARPRPAKSGEVVVFGELIRPSLGAVVIIKCGQSRREARVLSGLGDICPDVVMERGMDWELLSQMSEAPGPLPVLGTGVALGFSRKLRQRIKSSHPS